jgi:hypothetical protein
VAEHKLIHGVDHIYGPVNLCVRCGATRLSDGTYKLFERHPGFSDPAGGWRPTSSDCDESVVESVMQS